MNEELKSLLERQSEWQRHRSRLPWGEKLRIALTLRRTYVSLNRNNLAHAKAQRRKGYG